MLILPTRWLYRRWISPTEKELTVRDERMLAPPGAAGLLAIGAITLAPQPYAQLAWPALAACVAATLVHEGAEWREYRHVKRQDA